MGRARGTAATAAAGPAPPAEAQPADDGAQLQLSDLPDDVLIGVLRQLDGEFRGMGMKYRLATTCLVSRRWHELSHSAPLLDHVSAFLPRLPRTFTMPSTADAWRDWTSIAAWMRRHGAKVGSLSLMLGPTDRPLAATDRRRLFRLIWACLEPCQVAGAALRELSVTLPPGPLALPASLSRLGTLRTLDVGSVGGKLGPVAALQGLRSLDLTHLHATEAAQLPCGLTALKLGVREGVELPACGLGELAALVRLDLLAPSRTEYNEQEPACVLRPAACHHLACLTQLTYLRLSGWNGVSASLAGALAALSGLRSLHLERLQGPPRPPPEPGLADPELTESQLAAALGGLAQLETLGLFDVWCLQRPPATLAQLPRLQHLQAVSRSWGAGDAALPPGPWLARLRRLACDWRLLWASREAVAQAGMLLLEQLLVEFFHKELRRAPAKTEGLPAFWAWLWAAVGAPPALRLLQLDGIDESDEAGLHGSHRSLLAAMERARRARPGLAVEDDVTPEFIWEGLEGAPRD